MATFNTPAWRTAAGTRAAAPPPAAALWVAALAGAVLDEAPLAGAPLAGAVLPEPAAAELPTALPEEAAVMLELPQPATTAPATNMDTQIRAGEPWCLG